MEVLLTVMDRHFDEETSSDFGELKTVGEMTKDGDSFFVTYSETVDELNDCKTTLKITNSRITMMRSGRFSTSMIFENGQRHTALYQTPFGEVMIGIFTNAMFVDFDETGGILNFAYTIDCNGDLVSENELKILIEVKQ